MGDLIVSDNSNSLRSQFMPVFDLVEAVRRRNVIVQFTKELMVEGHDFGVIPGTDKKTLLKPGAEKLCTLFGLTSKMTLRQSVEDWDGKNHNDEPFFYYVYSCALYRGDFLIAETEASANSWEKKYRSVSCGRKCPECGAEQIRTSKNEPGFFCWRKMGGCGATFGPKDSRIISQDIGSKPNPFSADLVNTLQKMAQKRALIGTCLIAVNASEFYTQDIEDLPMFGDLQEAPSASTQQTPQPPRRPASAPPRTEPQGEVLEDHIPMEGLLDVPPSSASQGDAFADPMTRRATPAAPINKCPSCNAPEGKPHTKACTAVQEVTSHAA